jgi:hypothetical protein
VLPAPAEHFVRAGRLDDRHLVRLAQSMRECGVAPGGQQQRVGPRPLGAETVLVNLDLATGLDDAGHLAPAGEDSPRRVRARMPGMDAATAPRGRRAVSLRAAARGLEPGASGGPRRRVPVGPAQPLVGALATDSSGAQAVYRGGDKRRVGHPGLTGSRFGFLAGEGGFGARFGSGGRAGTRGGGDSLGSEMIRRDGPWTPMPHMMANRVARLAG